MTDNVITADQAFDYFANTTRVRVIVGLVGSCPQPLPDQHLHWIDTSVADFDKSEACLARTLRAIADVLDAPKTCVTGERL